MPNQFERGRLGLQDQHSNQSQVPTDFMSVLDSVIKNNEATTAKAKRMTELYNKSDEVKEFVKLMAHFQAIR